MSTILIAAILIGIVVAICLLLVSIDKKHKRAHMNQFLNSFSELATANKLAFSSQTLLRDCAIGLDGVHRKLLVLNNMEAYTFSHDLIDLDDVQSCSVKKIYGSINNSALKDHKLEQYLEKITLCFEFKTPRQPIEIFFYTHIEDSIYQASELEKKARHWEAVLSKMRKSPLQKIA